MTGSLAGLWISPIDAKPLRDLPMLMSGIRRPQLPLMDFGSCDRPGSRATLRVSPSGGSSRQSTASAWPVPAACRVVQGHQTSSVCRVDGDPERSTSSTHRFRSTMRGAASGEISSNCGTRSWSVSNDAESVPLLKQSALDHAVRAKCRARSICFEFWKTIFQKLKSNFTRDCLVLESAHLKGERTRHEKQGHAQPKVSIVDVCLSENDLPVSTCCGCFSVSVPHTN